VYVANFVLMNYGTSAVMAVPNTLTRLGSSPCHMLPIRMVMPSKCATRSMRSKPCARRRPDEQRARWGQGDRLRHRRALQVVEWQRIAGQERVLETCNWLVNSGEYDGMDFNERSGTLAARFGRWPWRAGSISACATGA
jgi:leucyl-tRNA synthetase